MFGFGAKVQKRSTREKRLGRVIKETTEEIVLTTEEEILLENKNVFSLAMKETNEDVLKRNLIFEKKNPNFVGVSALFTIDPNCLCWPSYRDGSEIQRMLDVFPDFDKKLIGLNSFKNTDQNTAFVIAGVEEGCPWRVKEIQKDGYTTDCFEKLIFLSKKRFDFPKKLAKNIFYELLMGKGTFEYKKTAYIIRSSDAFVFGNFAQKTDDPEEMYFRNVRNQEKFKIGESTDIIAKIAPPTNEELEIMNEIILAYERKLIRMGFKPSSSLPDGFGNSLLNRSMDKAVGLKSNRREYLVNPDENQVGCRMNDIEDIIEVIFLTNKIAALNF